MTEKQVMVDKFCSNIVGTYLPLLSATVLEANDKHTVHLYGHEIWLTLEKPYGKKEVIRILLQLYQNRKYVQHLTNKKRYTLIKDRATKKLLL